MSENKFRGLRAVVRTAITWGAAWAAAGGAVVTAIALFAPGTGIDSVVERVALAVMSGIAWGVRFGIAGAAMGTLFSTVIRVGYRGRRLADINPVRFALLGAVVGGVGVPLYLQSMNVLFGGGPIAWGLVSDDALWSTVFGAAAAAGSILLARRADTLSPEAPPAQLERGDDLDALLTAEQREISMLRTRSTPH